MIDKLEKRRHKLNVLIFTFIFLFLSVFYIYSRIMIDVQTLNRFITDITIQQKSIQRDLVNIVIKPDIDLELVSFNHNNILYFETNKQLFNYLNEDIFFNYYIIDDFYKKAVLGFDRIEKSKESFDKNILKYIDNERALIQTENQIMIRNRISQIAIANSTVHNLYYNTILNELRLILDKFENGVINYFLIFIFTTLLILGSIIIMLNISIYRFNRTNETILLNQLNNISNSKLDYLIPENELFKLNLSNKIVYELVHQFKSSLCNHSKINQDLNQSQGESNLMLFYSRKQIKEITLILKENNDESNLIVKAILNELEDVLLKLIHSNDQRRSVLERLNSDFNEFEQ